MTAIVANLSREDMANAACISAARKRNHVHSRPGTRQAGSIDLSRWIVNKAVASCASCRAQWRWDSVPVSAPGGHHAQYTADQLKAFAAGRVRTTQQHVCE